MADAAVAGGIGWQAISAALGHPQPASSDWDLAAAPPARPIARSRPAAVLVALQQGSAGTEVVLTRRSSRLRHHPGQIALPGGKVDAGDADEVAAALREAREEVGLDPRMAEVLGRLAVHHTGTGFAITPVVARLHGRFSPSPEAGEVDEVFAVPLAHLADPARYRIEQRRWAGTTRPYYVVPWGPYYIWGATARILRGFALRLAQ